MIHMCVLLLFDTNRKCYMGSPTLPSDMTFSDLKRSNSVTHISKSVSYGVFKRDILYVFVSSALCYCTAELLSSRGRPSTVVVRPSSVRRPSSVDIVFSDTTE